MFVTFQLHFSSYSEECLYAVLTFIFLGPDLTFYNYEISPKSDPESRCELLYPPLGGPLGDQITKSAQNLTQNLGASSCTPPLEVLWVIIAGQVGTQKNRARVKVQK